MNNKPDPFISIEITSRTTPPITRMGRTKYKMSCKRKPGGKITHRGFHTLQEARVLIEAWRRNSNVTADASIIFHIDKSIYNLQTEADWALVILSSWR